MSDIDDPAEAAIRLETALERIAALAQHPAAESPPQPDAARLAARLDALIANIRAALGTAAE